MNEANRVAENPNFVGLWLPRGAILCADLRGNELLLFGQIAALSGNPRGCHASNEYLSHFLKLAKSTVSEYVKSLQDKGLIDVLRGRDDNGQEERQIFLSVAGARLFMPDAVVPADTPSEYRSPPLRNTEAPPSEYRTQNKDINISLSARAREEAGEEAKRLYDEVMTAAGDAIDLHKHPQMAMIRDLICLKADLPNSPACTHEEIVDAVRFVGALMVGRYGAGSMRNWDFVCKKAREYRDKRVNGQPVRTASGVAPPPGAGLGDPSGFDGARWRQIINLANFKRVWLAKDWGPPPGHDGSFVPADLVHMWKGVVA